MATSGTGVTDALAVWMLKAAFPGDLVSEVVEQAEARERRRRSLPASLMVYYVLALALFAEKDYQEVMRLLADSLRWPPGLGSATELPTVPAITKARSRLGDMPFALLFDRVAGPLADDEADGSFCQGLRAVALDGLTFDMPETAANASIFGQPGHDDRLTPPSKARAAVLGECGTGSLIRAALGGPGERPPGRDLLPALDKTMLLLATRRFSCHALWPEATANGAQFLWQITSPSDLPVLRELPDGTHLARIAPRDGAAGEAATVRVIQSEAGRPGVLTVRSALTLVTTLLDPRDAPASELVACYLRRWQARMISLSLNPRGRAGNVVLRSKNPAMVRQEIWATLCVYQALRTVAWQAAQARSVPATGSPVPCFSSYHSDSPFMS